MTVGLPVYNQADILPLALTGLSKQVGAGEWELIVSSEDHVWDVIRDYQDRLLRAGCVKIVEDRLRGWIPLPEKWRRIGHMMDKGSLGLILQAADCYPHPDRIRQSKDAMNDGFDWYHERKGYFYDINTGRVVLFDGSFNRKSKTCLNMCVAKRHVEDLPLSDKAKGIDGWLFRMIKNPKVYLFKGLPRGVDVHGKNNISVKRGGMIKEYKPPFFKTNKRIEDIIDFKWR